MFLLLILEYFVSIIIQYFSIFFQFLCTIKIITICLFPMIISPFIILYHDEKGKELV